MPEVAPAPVLSLEVEHCAGNCAVVRCSGRLVAGVTDILYSRVTQLIPNYKRIVLDLSELKHTDSLGLGTTRTLFTSQRKSAGCSLEPMHHKASRFSTCSASPTCCPSSPSSGKTASSSCRQRVLTRHLLLQHDLLAFLQAAQYLRDRAVRQPHLHRNLASPFLLLAVRHLHHRRVFHPRVAAHRVLGTVKTPLSFRPAESPRSPSYYCLQLAAQVVDPTPRTSNVVTLSFSAPSGAIFDHLAH